MMRKWIISGAMAAVFFSHAAYADNVEGIITRIDAAAQIIQLDDGKNYNLPSELDYSLLSEGMKVLLFYDVDDNARRYVSAIEADGLDLDSDDEIE